MSDTRKDWLVRILIGGVLGAAGYLLLSFLTQPGAWGFGNTSWKFAFTFYYGNLVPEMLGGVLSGALWFAFGAEIAVATLPFAEEGASLLRRSLFHFAAMMLTVGLWAFLNFFNSDYPLAFFRGELWHFLVPVALVYVLIWLGRWVGWYAEVAAIRARLGLAPTASPLKWRETLPYLVFALILCDLLPLLMRLLDPVDFPVFSGVLLPLLLLPVGGACSGYSLGKRHGFCPLYPAACFLFYLPMVFLLFNSSALFHCCIAGGAALVGNALGAACRRRHSAETLSAD